MTISEYLARSTQPEPVGEVLSKKAEQELLAYCNKAYNICRQGRLQFERMWYMNMAFYFGRQYVEWAASVLDSSGIATESSFSRMYVPAAPRWRVRLICNKVRPIIRGELAKVTKEKPRGFVIPASTDDDDRAGAKAAEAINEALWRDLKMNRQYRRASFWNLLCGSAFVKDWYDKDAEDIMGVRGAIMAEPVSPFHLFVPDLQEEELEAEPFIIHALAKDPDWVERNFKKRVQPDSGAGAGILEQKFLTALGISQGNYEKRYVSVKEAWIKPNGKFKDGIVIIWAADTVLHAKEGWPYKHKEYPFAKIDHIPTGRFYGESSIVDLIPLQKEYNRTRSQIIESKNRMSKPQLAAVRGSVDPNKITSEPGLIVFYTPGYPKPEPIPLQNLPGYVIEEVQRIQRDMDDVSSQHEITRGSVPPGVTAATAISFLQEQDDSRLHMTISSLEEAVEKTGRHFLSHAQQFWTAQRGIRVIGENGQYEFYQFKGSDLKGNTDFKIEAGSATPTSRAAKQAFITELGKMGWIPPDRALRYLDMAETGRLYEEMQLDSRQAQRENIRLFEGEEFGSNSQDNDQVHLLEHENFMKTEKYETSADDVKMRFTGHCTTHKQRIALMMGLTLAPDDPKLDAIAKGLPVGNMAPGGENGQQPGQPPAGSQGGLQQSAV
jgi:hypothetical protein